MGKSSWLLLAFGPSNAVTSRQSPISVGGSFQSAVGHIADMVEKYKMGFQAPSL